VIAVNERELMMKIKRYDFALRELNLYLDTHPDCKRALALFQKYNELRKEAEREYNEKYGPITPHQSNNTSRWDWVDGKWPWERS
jgi:spore coat protein JB